MDLNSSCLEFVLIAVLHARSDLVRTKSVILFLVCQSGCTEQSRLRNTLTDHVYGDTPLTKHRDLPTSRKAMSDISELIEMGRLPSSHHTGVSLSRRAGSSHDCFRRSQERSSYQCYMLSFHHAYSAPPGRGVGAFHRIINEPVCLRGRHDTVEPDRPIV